MEEMAGRKGRSRGTGETGEKGDRDRRRKGEKGVVRRRNRAREETSGRKEGRKKKGSRAIELNFKGRSKGEEERRAGGTEQIR